MLESVDKGQLEVYFENNPVTISKKLGEGGTKRVYDATIDGEFFALAISNVVDGAEKMMRKWSLVRQEPSNTDRVRVIGLFTNPICELIPVSINGVPFTALKMKRNQDLPFQIMDGKNFHHSTNTDDILSEQLNIYQFEDYFEGIVDDIKMLLQNGVRLDIDSINICIVDGKPRIYLSDLGPAVFKPFSNDEISSVAENYVMFAVGAFLNGLTELEFQRHRVFFEGEAFDFNSTSSVFRRLLEKVLRCFFIP